MVAGKGRGAQVEIIEEKIFTTVEEIEQAILKLRRRLDQVQALNPTRVRFDDPRVRSAAENFSDEVLAIYGPNSPEYRRYQYHRIRHGLEWAGMSDDARQKAFADGVGRTIEALENLVRRLEERKADFGKDTATRVRAAFESLDLHPRIAAVCVDLFRDGHYRNAMLDASVALVNYVKEKSRRHDLDGSGLMTTVFS